LQAFLSICNTGFSGCLRSNSFGSCLNFIKDNKCIICINFKIAIRIQNGNYPVCIKINIKKIFRCIWTFKIYVRHLLVLCFAKLLQKVGFTNLSCAQKKKRLAILFQLPLYQLINLCTIHFFLIICAYQQHFSLEIQSQIHIFLQTKKVPEKGTLQICFTPSTLYCHSSSILTTYLG